ncbi:hypothetical protein PR048_017458 [Dryococelus australis]|uniref:Uncharacterized protein n=1 Tax=Dryococelus australis TaxID=614101 RepID=A0ABQ9H9N9_9NEOP|nr:hypothetical protein PR048_017458 [Dryococelus australis]
MKTDVIEGSRDGYRRPEVSLEAPAVKSARGCHSGCREVGTGNPLVSVPWFMDLRQRSVTPEVAEACRYSAWVDGSRRCARWLRNLVVTCRPPGRFKLPRIYVLSGACTSLGFHWDQNQSNTPSGNSMVLWMECKLAWLSSLLMGCLPSGCSSAFRLYWCAQNGWPLSVCVDLTYESQRGSPQSCTRRPGLSATVSAAGWSTGGAISRCAQELVGRFRCGSGCSAAGSLIFSSSEILTGCVGLRVGTKLSVTTFFPIVGLRAGSWREVLGLPGLRVCTSAGCFTVAGRWLAHVVLSAGCGLEILCRPTRYRKFQAAPSSPHNIGLVIPYLTSLPARARCSRKPLTTGGQIRTIEPYGPPSCNYWVWYRNQSQAVALEQIPPPTPRCSGRDSTQVYCLSLVGGVSSGCGSAVLSPELGNRITAGCDGVCLVLMTSVLRRVLRWYSSHGGFVSGEDRVVQQGVPFWSDKARRGVLARLRSVMTQKGSDDLKVLRQHCNTEYIGLTTNILRQRMNGHRADTKQFMAGYIHNLQDKPVAVHAASHNNDFNSCYSTRVTPVSVGSHVMELRKSRGLVTQQLVTLQNWSSMFVWQSELHFMTYLHGNYLLTQPLFLLVSSGTRDWSLGKRGAATGSAAWGPQRAAGPAGSEPQVGYSQWYRKPLVKSLNNRMRLTSGLVGWLKEGAGEELEVEDTPVGGCLELIPMELDCRWQLALGCKSIVALFVDLHFAPLLWVYGVEVGTKVCYTKDYAKPTAVELNYSNRRCTMLWWVRWVTPDVCQRHGCGPKGPDLQNQAPTHKVVKQAAEYQLARQELCACLSGRLAGGPFCSLHPVEYLRAGAPLVVPKATISRLPWMGNVRLVSLLLKEIENWWMAQVPQRELLQGLDPLGVLTVQSSGFWLMIQCLPTRYRRFQVTPSGLQNLGLEIPYLTSAPCTSPLRTE